MSIKVSVIAFYETERNDEKQILKGSLHIFLPDHGLNVRGVFVSKKKNFWFISLPCQTLTDGGERIRYPVVSFEPEKQAELTNIVREKGREFVEEYLKNNPKIPQKEAIETKEEKTGILIHGVN